MELLKCWRYSILATIFGFGVAHAVPANAPELQQNFASAADAVGIALRTLVETGDGGFSSMVGGQVGQTAWDIDGHYLLYCVITRTGGALVTPADPVTGTSSRGSPARTT